MWKIIVIFGNFAIVSILRELYQAFKRCSALAKGLINLIFFSSLKKVFILETSLNLHARI